MIDLSLESTVDTPPDRCVELDGSSTHGRPRVLLTLSEGDKQTFLYLPNLVAPSLIDLPHTSHTHTRKRTRGTRTRK